MRKVSRQQAGEDGSYLSRPPSSKSRNSELVQVENFSRI